MISRKNVFTYLILSAAKVKLNAISECLQRASDQYVNLGLKAFDKCEYDGNPGLSWSEIERCEDIFCGMLTIHCPTKEDFDNFDSNGDGILTMKEYLPGSGN